MLVKSLIIIKERGEELKVPYYASGAAARDGNLPHVTATYYTWWQYVSYSDHLPLFLTLATLLLWLPSIYKYCLTSATNINPFYLLLLL